MSDQQLNAIASLDAAIEAIGTSVDRFADRRQVGGFVAFATPGRLLVEVPMFAPAGADMLPQDRLAMAAPAPAALKPK